MSVINRVRALRLKRGLTQRALAERAGVSAVTVGRLDRDPRYQTTLRVMQRIAAALEVKVATVFREEACQRAS